MTNNLRSVVARTLVGLACLVPASQSFAQTQPSLNFSGQVGLIDMPSGEQLPDGYLTFNHSQFGPIVRNALRFQITPRLSGTFRYIGIHAWNANIPACTDDDEGTFCSRTDSYPTYYDRNFDISYQILTESRYLPAVTIGLQDFIGTSISSGEYIAATKNIGPRLKVTAGVGFGRLGSFGSMGQLFGPRPEIDFGKGGNFNVKQWFRGDAAPFGGIEYNVTDKLTFKAEYSSDAYSEEAAKRGTFERQSPFNFGLEYQPGPALRFGGYYLYGSEIGLNVTLFINPDQRPIGGIAGRGPMPVSVRPSRASNPDKWGTEWTEVEDVHGILLKKISQNLDGTGIEVESLGLTGSTVQVRFRNNTYDAAAQAVGRVARAMSQALPASVEVFELVPVDHGIPGAKVVLRRTDIEALEFAPDAGQALRARAEILEPGSPLPGTQRNPQAYPAFDWSLLPFTRTQMFNPVNPLQAGIGLRFAARYEPMPGLILSGSITHLAFSNIEAKACETCMMRHVRSDSSFYYTNGNPGVETLTAAWYTRIAPNLYGRITVGYLEQMYGGISTEVLWRPVSRPYALGAEINYVAQRDTDGGFGFNEYDYHVATGHVSGYYDFGNGFHAQLDVGRYLAGDVGATVALTREFENGWRIGAFATKTNVSAAEFGEGSFDKGIMLEIPMTWLTGKPTRTTKPLTIRPLGRDGGARLEVNDRLYDVLRSYDQTRLDAQWGRVWK